MENNNNQNNYPNKINNKYIIEKLLSKGSNSKVYIGQNINENIKIIIKKINITIKNKHKIIKEIEIPKKLNHPNIINILDHFEQNNITYIIYNYYENGVSLSNIKLTFIDNIKYYSNIFYQIVDAIQYLHNQKIIHMDIKPQNIIISNNKSILIDFDLSLTLNDEKTNFVGWIGTPNYMAPEIWKKKYKINYYLCDIYSLGITFYYICNKKLPYLSKTIEELENDINYKRPKKSNSGSTLMDNLIMSMIRKMPKKRPNYMEIKNILNKLISINS